MSNILTLSLLITLLGMGIVFGTIVILWGLMALLTNLLADKNKAADSPTPASVMEGEHKAQAAALAVAVALAEQELSTARPLPIPQTALVSAWQLGMRTRQMYQKGERVKTERRELIGLIRGNKE